MKKKNSMQNNKGNRLKVLVLYNKLFDYRIPIFNILGNFFDLTVCYSIVSRPHKDLNFKIIYLPIMKLGRFVFHKKNIFRLCSNYDVVLVYGDISWISYITIPFKINRKYKVIFWTIGVSASYGKEYDLIKRWDIIRNFFYKKAEALVFYTKYPIIKYIEAGFDEKRLFVANNTVEVIENNECFEKDSILFIGTLYKEKGIYELLHSYKLAYNIDKNILNLKIVGSGPEKDKISKWVNDNVLEKKISVLGSVYNLKEKSILFKKAYACISPKQAGLAVLESLGYGVPFVTMYNSITGGERFNISDGENGLLMSSIDQLANIISDISKNKDKYITMGINGKKYYEKYRKPEHMAQGIIDSIKFVSNN